MSQEKEKLPKSKEAQHSWFLRKVECPYQITSRINAFWQGVRDYVYNGNSASNYQGKSKQFDLQAYYDGGGAAMDADPTSEK